LRLVPGAIAVLIGKSINDLGSAACRRLVDDRTDGCSRHCYCGCCYGSRGDGMVAAASTVVASTTVATVYVHIYVPIDVDVVVDVGVAIDVLVDVGVSIDVLISVGIAIGTLVGVGSAIGALVGGVIGALVATPGWRGVDAGFSAGAGTTTATTVCAATTTAAAASALSGKCHSRYQDGDGEYGEELS